jgi:hypothetical protein
MRCEVSMAHGDPYSAWEDDLILSSIETGSIGYKRLASELSRTRDSVRSRYRELIGEGRETRRENRAIGDSHNRAGWKR